tara:strand:- start:9508 stop:9891 length:384 start_codon:yes stop_codon:yes gene_type:complete
MKKRQKYSNGGAIRSSKTFKGVGDFDLSLSGSVSGDTSNINKDATATLAHKKGSLSYGVKDNSYSKPSSSFSARANVGENSTVGATTNKYENSFNFNTTTKSKTNVGVTLGERNNSPFAELTISKPL